MVQRVKQPDQPGTYLDTGTGQATPDTGGGGGEIAVLAPGDYGDIISQSTGTSITLVIDPGVLTAFGRTVTGAANAATARSNLGAISQADGDARYVQKSTLAALGNHVDDAAAAAGGVAVGGLYRNGSALMVRVA